MENAGFLLISNNHLELKLQQLNSSYILPVGSNFLAERNGNRKHDIFT